MAGGAYQREDVYDHPRADCRLLCGCGGFCAPLDPSSFDRTGANWLYLVYPVVGIYLTSLFVRYIVKDNISHGITRILYAISSNRSRLKSHNCWSSVIASAITIGFGGSVGAEAPIVLTGSAIGSNLGKLFHMDRKMLMTLVGCGAAGAIAGIFKAPIAGLVFTLEVLMIDMTMSALLPILVSCVTATCFTYIFSGDAALFTFHLDSVWSVQRIPACVLLGITCGLVSLYFIRMMGACEDVFARFKDKPYIRLAIGGTVLSLLIFLFPALYGEGYSSINLLLNGRTEADWNQILDNSLFAGQGAMLIPFIALVLLTKVIATSATNGGGGCGGTFAPSLFIGCFAGFLFSRLWNINQIGVYVPEKNFALLGMAGVMSGVMHAPLTHCRAHGRLYDVYAADDCQRMRLSHHYYLRTSQHLWFSFGPSGKVAYASYRPRCADADESGLSCRAGLSECDA